MVRAASGERVGACAAIIPSNAPTESDFKGAGDIDRRATNMPAGMLTMEAMGHGDWLINEAAAQTLRAGADAVRRKFEALEQEDAHLGARHAPVVVEPNERVPAEA